jgi:hypothetical protein
MNQKKYTNETLAKDFYTVATSYCKGYSLSILSAFLWNALL